ncbi:MAG: hypothetical protein N4A46_13060, partial [Schleiferiaceae bacterium]|nr:hypothetical protein [Schleiferiaceae bacterium]
CSFNGSSDDPVYSPYLYISGRTPGETILIRVWRRNNLHGTPFQIKAFEPSPIPTNEVCASAVDLPVGAGLCATQQYTGLYSLGDPTQTAPGCAGYTNQNDVWFKFSLPASGNIQLSVDRVSGSINYAMALYSGSCGSLALLQCADNGSPLDPGLSPGINYSNAGLAGQTLYVRVWRNSNIHGGEFLICAYDPGYTLHTWTGASSTDWNTLANWDVNGLPNSTGVVLIPSSAANQAIIGPGETKDILSMEIENGAGFVMQGPSTLNIYGDLLINGSFDMTSAIARFVGVNDQRISGILGSAPKIGILEFSTTSLTLYRSIEVIERVVPTMGTLDLNGRDLRLTSGFVGDYAQIERGSGDILGNSIVYERFMNTAEGWRQFALPVSTSLSFLNNWTTILTNGPDHSIYWWNASDVGSGIAGGWTPATSIKDNTTAYVGYVSSQYNISNPVEIRGGYVNGDQSFTVYNTQDPNNPSNMGWNFIPNPFLTNLDLFKMLDDYDADGLSSPNDYPLGYSGVHIWNGGDNVSGQYVSIINSVSVNTGNAGADALGPMGGFWVKMENTDAASETFVVKDNNRNYMEFSYNALKTFKPTLRISYSNAHERRDDIALYIDQNASKEFNPRLDAYKLLLNESDLGELYMCIDRENETVKTSIKSFSINSKIDTIDIAIAHQISGSLGRIDVSFEDFPNYKVLLLDQQENHIHSLKGNPYRFIHSEADTARFKLVLVHPSHPFYQEVEQQSKIQVYSHLDNLHVLSSIDQFVNIRINDLSGREIVKFNRVRLMQNEQKLLPLNIEGIYIIYIEHSNGQSLTRKLVFTNEL